MRLSYLTMVAVLLMSIGATAQNNQTEPATFVGTASSLRIEPSLASKQTLNPAEDVSGKVMQDGRAAKYDVIPGKGAQEEDDFLMRYHNQLEGQIPGKTPSLVFDVNATGLGTPSDPAIGVGPDHMFGVFNTGFIVYDKEGNDLTGPLNVNNIFSNGGCCDLTVSYDSDADRWVVCYLLFSGMEVAVSDGPDPITSDWYVYSVSQINDYNKLSVWSDGYYVTQNSGSNKVIALERDAMLAGESAANVSIQAFDPPGMVTSGFSSCQIFNVTDDNMPAAGNATVVYMQDDAWAGVTTDHLKIWSLNIDWNTPGNSSISAATQLTTTPFISVFDGGSFSNLTQPGGGSDIDALQATIMNQAQFRKFSDHNSAVFNFVVDADASAGELAAIRWFELRQDADGMPWTIFQEGTFTSPDGKHAWNASLMMDLFGNIGMGYNAMAGPDTPNPTSNRVSSFYTGRYAADPAGTMSVAEELISAGTGNIGGTRFGDYSKIDIDPNNNKEFWFATEYQKSGRKNVVGVFQIASDFNNDIGVISIDAPEDGTLTAAEAVTVTVFNFGLDDAVGFNVEYSVDGGAVVSEPYVGVLASATSASFTFVGTTDMSTVGQTYSISANTALSGDEFPDNDGVSKDVTHLDPNDVGVTSISSPTSASGLSAAEAVTVTIQNFGAATQTSIPVYYSIDGGTPVQETYTGSIATGESDDYTFAATADLSALGDYAFMAGTELAGDSDETNDDVSATVTNFLCQPESNCAGFNDGAIMLQLADQDIDVACGGAPAGYSDDTDIIFNFMLEDNPFDGVIQMGYDDTSYVLWIDFNDNYNFEESEVVSTESVPLEETDFAISVDLADVDGVTPGMHLMRLRSFWNVNGTGELMDPCGDMSYGRTNDFTANISGSLVGLSDNLLSHGDLTITPLNDDQFQLQYNTATYTDRLPVTILDVQGQKLAYYTLTNNGNGYAKTIDMSYVAAGIYFVKVGDDSMNVVKRILVK